MGVACLAVAFQGVVIANNSYTRDTAEGVVRSGAADAVGFGRLFIANPDLAERFQHDWPLNERAPYDHYWNPTLGADGYLTYESYDVVLKKQQQKQAEGQDKSAIPFRISGGMLARYAKEPSGAAEWGAPKTPPTLSVDSARGGGTMERPTRRPKSNSERGKEFRAKRKKHEAELEAAVYRLRAHIAEMEMTRTVYERKALQARHNDTGSLPRLIREYFSMFRFGLRNADLPMGNKRSLLSSEAALHKIKRQELFLHQIIDNDAVVGEKLGPSASIAQWRSYTIAHGSLRHELERMEAFGTAEEPIVVLERMEAFGTAEEPIVVVYSSIYVRISRDTFKYMFPKALQREDIVQRFVHRDVVYRAVFRFHFTPEGRIAFEGADIGIIDGLREAGFSTEEIAELMEHTVVTSQSMIPEIEPDDRVEASPLDRTTAVQSPKKLSVEFLLSHDDEQQPEHDEHDATPLGAFVATLPAPTKRRPKSSSERGKAFRARQRQYELELEKSLRALRDEITSLEMQQRARDSMRMVAFSGSALAKIVLQYHDLFRNGLPGHPECWLVGQKRPLVSADIRQVHRQEEFISRVMHPDAVVGAAIGPDASIQQWRLYTAAHYRIEGKVLRTHVSGSPGDLTVVAHCTLREVEYHAVKHFHFTPDGRIDRETVDVNFVEGLVRAGLALNDVMQLMSTAAITSDSMIEPKREASRPSLEDLLTVDDDS
ncbi:hypothetical protein ATCC90586_004065 [Pythium insidiosum]|nr:hypothetical protein ATCC90586_004065 [Pythium insidiosum]